MEQLTGLGKTILATDPDKIRLDQAVKNILAYKPLLARVFKEVVSECRDMDYDEIEACIEGEVLISSVYVDGGLSNAGERIDGLSTEAYLNEEGLDKYDLRTYLRLPGTKTPERVKLLINVEAQNEDKPGYDISLRALFYCCRMISAQQGVEFSTDADDPVKYGNIKKVYSIWICTETAQKRANSIERYAINRQMLAGSNTDKPRYDILNAIIINISGRHDTGKTKNGLIHMLTDLFDERIDGAQKVVKLKEYGLKLTKEVENEVSDMCTYAATIENKGIEKGIEKGLKALVQSLREYIKDFDSLYKAVTKNEDYKNVSREEVMKYYR
jgi:chorismate mutase